MGQKRKERTLCLCKRQRKCAYEKMIRKGEVRKEGRGVTSPVVSVEGEGVGSVSEEDISTPNLPQ